MSALFYRHCYILTAGVDYHTNTTNSGGSNSTSNSNSGPDLDVTCHISNLSVNKHIEGYPGQIPCDLAVEYPQV